MQRRFASQRAGVQPIGRRLSPRTQDFDLAAYSHTQSRTPV